MSKKQQKTMQELMETYRMYLDEIIRLNDLIGKQLIKTITLYEEQIKLINEVMNNE